VAPLARIVLISLTRRSALLSIVGVVAMSASLPAEARAGLTVSLWGDVFATECVCSPDPPGSSSRATATSDLDPKQRVPARGPNREERLALASVADTEGTSTPVRGPAGSGASPAAAVLGIAVRAPVVSTFRHLREAALHLQQPTNRELLDPPKRG
jgi:hypothetical protein